MARTENLTNFLTDVATAIKTKKGSQENLYPEDFDTEIQRIIVDNEDSFKTSFMNRNTRATTKALKYYDFDENERYKVKFLIFDLEFDKNDKLYKVYGGKRDE